MVKKKILLVGGGGHCKACIDVIEQIERYEIFGIIDIPENRGGTALGYSVVGDDDDIPRFAREGYGFVVTLGQIESPKPRMRLFDKLRAANAAIETIISPLAYVSKHAIIGEGTVVMHKAIVNSAAVVGENCILNTASTVEHDVTIGAHTHVSTHAVVNGGCSVGDGTFIGSNAVVSSGIAIVANSVIGAQAAVIHNVTSPGIYLGCPAKKKEK